MPVSPHEDAPELATTEYWRGIMRRARADHGLTQEQLAAKVGISQNVISGIESGKVGQSRAITAICEALDIPPPQMLFTDEVEQRWVEVGRAARALLPDVYEASLETLDAILKKLKESKGA
jgi:transcriptional regulator with XRE-family HTH domain